MEQVLALLGLLFFLFLVLAAAVEVILEVFRGTLERFGITWAKGKMSLEEALKFSAEFAPGNSGLAPKLQALKTATEQLKDKATVKLASLTNLEQKLAGEGADAQVLSGELNSMATSVRLDLENDERHRIFLIRLLAAVIGCVLVWWSHFYVFAILAESSASTGLAGTFVPLKDSWINVVVGGLAASVGSSYWHDQLDKVRNLKGVAQEMRKLAA